MFYVIGSENSKSGSAFYNSRQQNQRRGGAVRHFRCADTVSGKTDLWWNIGIRLCHHYTDTSLIRQVSEFLSLCSEFQRAVFNGIRKRSLYWLGHLGAIYQRVFGTFFEKSKKISRPSFLRVGLFVATPCWTHPRFSLLSWCSPKARHQWMRLPRCV